MIWEKKKSCKLFVVSEIMEAVSALKKKKKRQCWRSLSSAIQYIVHLGTNASCVDFYVGGFLACNGWVSATWFM